MVGTLLPAPLSTYTNLTIPWDFHNLSSNVQNFRLISSLYAFKITIRFPKAFIQFRSSSVLVVISRQIANAFVFLVSFLLLFISIYILFFFLVSTQLYLRETDFGYVSLLTSYIFEYKSISNIRVAITNLE